MAVYYLMLTSGRFAAYRPEPLVGNFKAIPLPDPQPNSWMVLRQFLM